MNPCTPIRYEFHSIPGHVRPQHPWSLASLDCLAHRRGQELDMYLHTVDNLQVGIDKCEQRSLTREVP